jgi:hypothetical protein
VRAASVFLQFNHGADELNNLELRLQNVPAGLQKLLNEAGPWCRTGSANAISQVCLANP